MNRNRPRWTKSPEFHVAVEYQIPQNRQETLKEKLDFYAKLSGLPIVDPGVEHEPCVK